MKKGRGFTLVETLVAVAILGLVAAGSIRLTTLSVRVLDGVRAGREILAASRNVWLRSASGKLERRGRERTMSWETDRFYFARQSGLSPDYFCKKVILVLGDGTAPDHKKRTVMYVPEEQTEKGRAK